MPLLHARPRRELLSTRPAACRLRLLTSAGAAQLMLPRPRQLPDGMWATDAWGALQSRVLGRLSAMGERIQLRPRGCRGVFAGPATSAWLVRAGSPWADSVYASVRRCCCRWRITAAPAGAAGRHGRTRARAPPAPCARRCSAEAGRLGMAPQCSARMGWQPDGRPAAACRPCNACCSPHRRSNESSAETPSGPAATATGGAPTTPYS